MSFLIDSGVLAGVELSTAPQPFSGCQGARGGLGQELIICGGYRVSDEPHPTLCKHPGPHGEKEGPSRLAQSATPSTVPGCYASPSTPATVPVHQPRPLCQAANLGHHAKLPAPPTRDPHPGRAPEVMRLLRSRMTARKDGLCSGSYAMHCSTSTASSVHLGAGRCPRAS